MIGEFMSIGPLSMHVVMRGDNKGKSSKKQTWEHIHLGHKFVWHYAFNQNEFAKDKPWKVVREILKKSLKGYQRMAEIMKAARMPVTNGTDYDGCRCVQCVIQFEFRFHHNLTHKIPSCVLLVYFYCAVYFQEKLIQFCVLLLLRLALEQNLHSLCQKIYSFEIT